jgi:hypothetical protein
MASFLILLSSMQGFSAVAGAGRWQVASRGNKARAVRRLFMAEGFDRAGKKSINPFPIR